MRKRSSHLCDRFAVTACVIASIGLASPLHAQTKMSDKEWQAQIEASGNKAMQACGDATESVTNPDNGNEVTFSVSGGDCVDGKRNGNGTVIRRFKGAVSQLIETEGRFVAGVRLGLWCQTRYERTPPLTSDWRTCYLVGTDAKGGYRKLADGRWQMYAFGLPAEPATYLAAGELEARSEKVLSDARASTPGNPDYIPPRRTAIAPQSDDPKVPGAFYRP